MTYHSDPTRWSQLDGDAPGLLRDAFNAGSREGPSDLQMRTLALKLAAVGTGAALAAGASAAQASTTAAGGTAAGGAFAAAKVGSALTLTKLAVSVALVGAAAGGAMYLRTAPAPQLTPQVQNVQLEARTERAQHAATPSLPSRENLGAPITAPAGKQTQNAVAALEQPAKVEAQHVQPATVSRAVAVDTAAVEETAGAATSAREATDAPTGKSHHTPRAERRAAASHVASPVAAPAAVGAERVAGQRQQLSEIELLRSARSALAAHPREAYRLAEQHKQLYPQGVFTQERDALAVEALQRAGDLKLARKLAEGFVQKYPSSPHAHRFRETMNLQ